MREEYAGGAVDERVGVGVAGEVEARVVPDGCGVCNERDARALSKVRIFAIALAVVLMIGFLAWSLSYVLSDGPNAWVAFAYNGDTAAIEAHIQMRTTAEGIHSAARFIFFWGNVILLYFIVKNRLVLGYRRILVFTLAVLGAVLLCTVPFVLASTAGGADILFPLWGLIPELLLLCVAFVLGNFYCTRKTAVGVPEAATRTAPGTSEPADGAATS